MIAGRTIVSPAAEGFPFERLPPGVRTFLVESQHRVLDHCRRLLSVTDLAGEHRGRLTRLAAIVETELQHLVD